MRSVYENVPYDIHWHLIVQDEYQIPTFLDKSKLIYYNDESTPGSLRIIYHRDYFPDLSVLPVFNSNAIEIAMYNLKGVGECVMYFNDDFFVNSPITPSLNFDENGKIKSYFYQGTVFDVGKGSYYDKANANSNELINKHYNENLRRNRAIHFWNMFRMSYFKLAGKLFEKEFNDCSKNKLRSDNDIGFYTFIYNFMRREGLTVSFYEHSDLVYYIELTTNRRWVQKDYETLRSKKHPFFCINDGLDKHKGSEKDINLVLNEFQEILNDHFSLKTPFEIDDTILN